MSFYFYVTLGIARFIPRIMFIFDIFFGCLCLGECDPFSIPIRRAFHVFGAPIPGKGIQQRDWLVSGKCNIRILRKKWILRIVFLVILFWCIYYKNVKRLLPFVREFVNNILDGCIYKIQKTLLVHVTLCLFVLILFNWRKR